MLLRKLTDEDRKELKRMTRREIGRVSQRAQMILLVDQGRMYTEIARIFDTSTVTVNYWIGRFNASGPAGLFDQPRSGRPRKVTAVVKETIEDLARHDPADRGFVATFWTAAMLALAVIAVAKLTLSASTVRVALRDLGLRWGRPRLAMPIKVDPDKARRRWLIAEAVLEAGLEAVVLYADESRVQLLPLLRAMWQWAGQQLRVPTPGTNESRAVFGALDIRTGRWVHLVRPTMKAADFIAFLEHVLAQYPGVPIILIVDNFASHTAHVVREWCDAHPRLRIMFLPTYCSHLNPVEDIWRQLKGKVAANRLYGSMAVLLQTVEGFFAEMTPAQALQWAAAA